MEFDLQSSSRLSPVAQILILVLIFLSFPVLLTLDVYLIPGEVPSTAIYAIPVLIASRLYDRSLVVAVLLIGLGSEVAGAIIEKPNPVSALLAMLALVVIGVLSLAAAEAERRSAKLASERASLYEKEQQRTVELEDSRKRFLDFFSMVAHDLRNPLTTIMSCNGMLAHWDTLGPEQRERVRASAQLAVKSIARLANDLADASQIGSGHFAVSKSRFDLVGLLKNLVEQRQATAPAHHLVLETSESHLDGLWDEDRLAQAFGNLIDNAIKYSPEGGEVRVALSRRDERVRIAVTDQGIGIAAKDIPFILQFQPYSRFHRATGIKGLGLGLYITKGIVEAHKGNIQVHSELGKGSTFVVELPVKDPP